MGRISGSQYWSNKEASEIAKEPGVEERERQSIWVIWKDAYEDACWEELTAELCLVTSVGFDGGEKNGYQILYTSVTNDGATGGVLRIPIESIQGIRGRNEIDGD